MLIIRVLFLVAIIAGSVYAIDHYFPELTAPNPIGDKLAGVDEMERTGRAVNRNDIPGLDRGEEPEMLPMPRTLKPNDILLLPADDEVPVRTVYWDSRDQNQSPIYATVLERVKGNRLRVVYKPRELAIREIFSEPQKQ